MSLPYSQATTEMTDITPFSIKIDESQIADLKQRLALAKLPDELDNAAWDYGAPLFDVKRLLAFWTHRFDWRKAEKRLNQFPQYTTHIQCDGFESLRIHFLYKKSDVPGAIPLLFVHGWPGSFLEGTKIFHQLTQGNRLVPAFDVVVISLPNYGFSEGSRKRGFAMEQYAETCNKLMLKLGYDQYVTQGGSSLLASHT